MAPRILLVDDHELTLIGLQEFIRETYPAAIISTANDGDSAFQRATSESFDLIILDISMPKRNGIQVLKALREQGNEVPIIILSGNDEYGAGLLACRLGAWAFVRKSGGLEEVRNAITCVLAEQKRFFGPSIQPDDASVEPSDPTAVFECLSDQEYLVFRHLSQGRGSKEIADILGISYKTVRTYRGRVFKKLGLKSDAHAVHLGVKTGIA